MEGTSQRTTKKTEDSGPKSPRSPKGSPKNISKEEQERIAETKRKAKEAIKKKTQKNSLSNYAYHIVIGGFILICALALFSTLLGGTKKLSLISVIDEEEIAVHNQAGHSFTIGKNDFFDGWMLSDAKYIINNQISSKSSLPRCMTIEDTTIIPEKYNTREQHSECARPIPDQFNCSSSYTVAAVSALSDRFCIQTKGEKKPALSAQTVIACDQNKNNGCKGGSVTSVFDYAKKQGLVDESCLPFTGDPEVICPSTLNTCDKYHVTDYCVTSGEEGIKREILKNGPVIAVIPIYRDFLVYKDGVYETIEGTSKFHSGHALKVIGWDKTEKGDKYWIVENSWREGWGQNGLGYVAVGQKNLYIDEFVIAPHPMIDKADTEAGEDLPEERPEEVNMDE